MTTIAEYRSRTSGGYDYVPLELPPVIGKVDPIILENLADRIPSKIFPNNIMEVNDLEMSLMSDAERILTPVTEMLNQDAVETTGVPYTRISYDFDTRTAKIGTAQRKYSHQLHTDGFPQAKVMLLSSALPTEFLIEGLNPLSLIDRSRLLARAGLGTNPYKPDGYSLDDSIISPALNLGHFEIAHPEPYEIVVTENHLHRSAINLGTTAIDKVFVRARLTEAK